MTVDPLLAQACADGVPSGTSVSGSVSFLLPDGAHPLAIGFRRGPAAPFGSN